MTDREALLAMVCEHPTEDTPRLLFADWCEENGEADRAEFVRVQVELARLPIVDPECLRKQGKTMEDVERALVAIGNIERIPCSQCYPELRRRERELLQLDYSPILGGRSRQRNGAWERNPYGIIGAAGVAMDWCDIRRGFVEAVECDWQTWLAHEAALYWRSGLDDPCPWCRGSNMYWPAGREPGGASPPWETCSCGTGRIPRPFVATAQPIETVRLTVAPDAAEFEDGLLHFTREKCSTCAGERVTTSRDPNRTYDTCFACHGQPINSWTCERWRGVKFVMPVTAEYRLPAGGWRAPEERGVITR